MNSVAKMMSVVCVAGLACLAHGLKGHGQGAAADQQGTAEPAKPAEEKAQYLGAAFCGGCHSPGTRFPTDYVQLNEYPIWKEKDKHARAYEVLDSERSKQIGKLMNIDVKKDTRCLNCHAVNIPKELQYDGAPVKLEEGVTCDACHGPSSKWVVPHALPPWRTRSTEDKEKLGMIDVRNPVKRSQMCFSCHIGNVEQGKFVTHEMYAAGHPPLPGIEVATFSERMPRHWRHLKEKPESIKKLLKFDPEQLDLTRLVVIAGLGAFRESAKLLADQAAKVAEGKEAQDQVLDLSNYDCYACHHDLKSSSWRQKRGYLGKSSGRPQMHYWPLALLKKLSPDEDDKAEQRAGSTGGFGTGLRELIEGFDVQPFGARAKIASAGAKLTQQTDHLVQNAMKPETKYNQATARRLLQRLCTAGDEFPDYDSARQIAWAFQAIYSDLNPKPAGDAQVKMCIKALETELRLEPYGADKPITEEQEDALEARSRYDPKGFKEAMKKLSGLLAAEKP